MRRVILVAAMLLVPVAASAYLLPGAQILRKAGSHREDFGLSTLIARGHFSFHGAEAAAAAQALGLPADDELALPATISYKLPGRCRIDLEVPAGREAISVANVEGGLRASGVSLPSLSRYAARVCPLIDLQGGSDGIVGLIRSFGIRTAEVSLGRIGSTVAYVIGGRPKREETPSLWIDKERYAPLRLVVREGETVHVFHLTDYSSAAAGEWHPRTVEIVSGGVRAARFSLDAVQANAKIPDSRF